MTLEQIIDQACATFGVTTEDLQSSRRSQSLVRARAWVAHQAVSLRVTSVAAVARHLNRDESSLRHGMKQHFHYP